MLLVTLSVSSVIVSGVIFHSIWLMIIQSILNTLCVFTQAKGKIINQFIGVVAFIFYAAICFQQKFYGEVLLYCTIIIPVYVYGSIHWLKNKSKINNVVIVKDNISKKEWIISSMVYAGLTIAIYFLLKALNTEQLIVSTLSFITILPGIYLLIRRCKWNQLAFLINDLIVPILWIVLLVNGSLYVWPVFISFIFQLMFDVYGFFEWIKLAKQQKQQNLNH